MRSKKVDKALKARNLPLTRGTVVCAPRQSLVRPVRRGIATAIHCRQDWDNCTKAWACSRITVVTGRSCKFSDDQNCSRLSRRFSWRQLAEAPEDEVTSAQMGWGATRVESNWLLPKRPTTAEDFESVKKAVLSTRCLFGEAASRRIATSKAVKALRASSVWRRERKEWAQTHSLCAVAAAKFQKPRGHVICPDDKARQYKWWLPVRAYFLMMAWFVNTSATWFATDLDPETANAWCTQLLLSFIPHSLHRQMGIRAHHWYLPYVYTSLKAKCFGTGDAAGHRTCQKPGHSCVRRIVSYSTWRARRAWRAVGRALSFVVIKSTSTDEINSLKEARPVMDARLERLCAPRVPGCCDRCHSPCLGLQGITADAGQFYEAVSSTDACEAAGAILKITKEDGHSAVTVAGSRHAFFGGVVYRSMQKCLVFTLQDLYWLFAAASCMEFAHTGSQAWTFTGLPIGGLLSKAATSFVLGWQEHCWNTDSSKRRAANFEWSDRLWNHMVARGRCVDDLLWLSFALCESCLREGVQHAYSVPFEIEGPTDGALCWLDFKVQLRPLIWACKRKDFIALPPWAVSSQYAFGILMGRMSGWKEMHLRPLELAEALVGLFSDFNRRGWTKRSLRKTIYRVAPRCMRRDGCLLLRVFHTYFSFGVVVFVWLKGFGGSSG